MCPHRCACRSITAACPLEGAIYPIISQYLTNLFTSEMWAELLYLLIEELSPLHIRPTAGRGTPRLRVCTSWYQHDFILPLTSMNAKNGTISV